ncbi:hypothetical protein CONPUDRAFT_75805 [Coniophora puteana RWD-64-598 SS2]|uniref:Uncharacterized protein n=1 Tax=Coniophora puteana (strain RWD-64-598) TaxID=741705 RepID=A0A5M3MGF5_CONPW|nr:uncharacterized protein CONPUDRAFT_75805 [Coniophora puteana RWD-64-598 SS2]EIW78076.1 hypothetical protein CONPUDRAFT_75805 [Coniophora puteana RWD-64-598 SS2]
MAPRHKNNESMSTSDGPRRGRGRGRGARQPSGRRGRGRVAVPISDVALPAEHDAAAGDSQERPGDGNSGEEEESFSPSALEAYVPQGDSDPTDPEMENDILSLEELEAYANAAMDCASDDSYAADIPEAAACGDATPSFSELDRTTQSVAAERQASTDFQSTPSAGQTEEERRIHDFVEGASRMIPSDNGPNVFATIGNADATPAGLTAREWRRTAFTRLLELPDSDGLTRLMDHFLHSLIQNGRPSNPDVPLASANAVLEEVIGNYRGSTAAITATLSSFLPPSERLGSYDGVRDTTSEQWRIAIAYYRILLALRATTI